MSQIKKVGLWIRVSTDFQVKDESPEHHERRGRMYAETKAWDVVEVYRLDALSGKSVIAYPETQRMLKDIRDGRITGLIFSKLARLARNTRELLEFAEIFRACNADLISLAESIDTSTPAGRLFYTMVAAMAQWEREEIADRVAASVPIRAKMGKPLGGQASFGYKWEDKELVIDEKEAPIRKQLYEVFLKTKRKKATASELNKEGYRTRKGSKFSDTTVGRLLRDTTAKGIRRANYTKSTGDKKAWIIKPQSEWIELPCSPIISEELWNECNLILDQQEKKRNPVGPRPSFLLAGYIECTCGTKMYVYHKAPMYVCKACKSKIAVEDIDYIFHQQLEAMLLPEMNGNNYQMQFDNAIIEKENLLRAKKSEYTKLFKRVEELVNLRIKGEYTKETFAPVFKPIEEQFLQVQASIPELEAEIDFLKIQSLSSDTIISEAKNLYQAWENLPFEEKRSIVELITERIVIDKEEITVSFSYLPAPHLSKMKEKGNAAMPLRIL